MSNQESVDKKADVERRFKKFLQILRDGPDLKLPEPEPLPSSASEVDKMLVKRVELLEEKAAFVQKVVWRTSAALIGAFVASSPARDFLLGLLAAWLGGGQ